MPALGRWALGRRLELEGGIPLELRELVVSREQDVQESGLFQLPGAAQRTNYDRRQAAGSCEIRDSLHCGIIVTADEDIQWVPAAGDVAQSSAASFAFMRGP